MARRFAAYGVLFFTAVALSGCVIVPERPYYHHGYYR